MTDPIPSPCLVPRVWPTAKKYLYIDGIDLTIWVDRPSLQNAEKLAQQASVETMTLKLQHQLFCPGNTTRIPDQLPVIRDGQVPVMYIERRSLDPTDYNVIFSGVVADKTIGDESLPGSTTLTIATPQKLLRDPIAGLVFRPETTGDDVQRIRDLGRQWGRADFDMTLPEWEDHYNVSFPMPKTDADTNLYVTGQIWTPYENTTVADILLDLMTDPGQTNDDGYPVPDRLFWWEARFADDDAPTSGVIWKLYMVNPLNAPVGPTLSDDPRDGFYTYDSGVTLKIDYMTVVRKVHVAGDPATAGPLGYQQPCHWAPSGSTAPSQVYAPSDNWVRKIGGLTTGWDTTACTAGVILPGDDFYQPQVEPAFASDFDFRFQVQETYLAHDPFVGEDTPKITVSSLATTADVGFPKGYWEHLTYTGQTEANYNTWARISNFARPYNRDGTAIAVMETFGVACLIRAHVMDAYGGLAILFNVEELSPGVLGYANALLFDGTYWQYAFWNYNHWDVGGQVGPGHAGGGEQQIKINRKGFGDDGSARLEVYFDDVLDANFSGIDVSYANGTRHGVMADSSYGGTFWASDLKDFSVTEFWGDKAIGVGDLQTGEAWYWIGYGFVFNTDGTTTLIQGGTIHDTLGCGDYGQLGTHYSYDDLTVYADAHDGKMPPDVPYLWADIQKARAEFGRQYYPDDAYQLTCVLYMDPDSRSTMRKVQWWKYPGGAGEAVLLTETVRLAHDIIHITPGPHAPLPNHVMDVGWYWQCALKDLGATFTNCTCSNNYSNLFLPTGPLADTLWPLEGEYPATGVIQDERLNTYIKRQKVADGIFRAVGNPHVSVDNCVVHPLPTDPEPFQRGMLCTFINRRAGWVDADAKQLMVRSVRRVEGGPSGKVPRYSLRLGNIPYDITDPARSHLMRAGEEQNWPINLDIPALSGVYFHFSDTVTNDQYHGERIELKVTVLGKGQGAGALPIFSYPANSRVIQIPQGVLPPNTAYEAQHRVVSANGKPSAWSPKYTGVTPPDLPYDRPYTVNFYLGDGQAPFSVPADATGMPEIQIHEASTLIMWSIALNLAGEITFDIQSVGAQDRMLLGPAGYVSLPSTGVKPYTLLSKYSGLANQGSDFRDWFSGGAAILPAGTWLRPLITAVAGGTDATLATVSLTMRRVAASTT